MFQSIQPAPPDPILGLNEAFKADTREEKINLSVGVFKDDEGRTPALECVRKAEQQLLGAGGDFGYLGIDGLPAYTSQVKSLVLGEAGDRGATAQTPGGTGALRIAGELIHHLAPNAAIWCSTPTWGNHLKVFAAAGLEVNAYAYADADQRGLDFEAMCETLKAARPGDVVCLHACCHNPTGIDPTPEQWSLIAELLAEQNLFPLIDMAYQGFGEGLDADAAGLRTVVRRCPEAIICSSFSKNFSLYGERVGAVTVVSGDLSSAETVMSHVKTTIRANYSNPPRHGASVVATVLNDAELRSLWERELGEMRSRIHDLRNAFVEQMAQAAPNHDFSFIRDQCGMFSNSGLSPLQVDQLRTEHAIYIVGNGRMNVAGMTTKTLPRLCHCIASVLDSD